MRTCLLILRYFSYAYLELYKTFSSYQPDLAWPCYFHLNCQIEQSIGGAEIKRETRQFFVAIDEPEWDDSLSIIDDAEYFLDGTGSNVENGLGYVVGISFGWFRLLMYNGQLARYYYPLISPVIRL